MTAVVWNPRESDLASFIYATLALAVVLAILHWLIGKAQAGGAEGEDGAGRRRNGLWSLVIGADNRWSTSKVQPVLWTVTMVWAFLVLLFRIEGGNAKAIEKAFNIEGEYLILVGFPAAASLVAKVLTMTRVDTGAMDKPAADEPKVTDIVTNDEGTADLGDWQYFLFNLVALATFYSLFVAAPENGLPALPETLFALTGASAALYVAKKGTEGQKQPEIRWIRPNRIKPDPGEVVEITGSRFVAANDTAPSPGPRQTGDKWWVRLGDVELISESWTDTTIVAKLPPDGAILAEQTDAELVVYDTRGRASEPKSVPIAAPAT